MIHEECLSIFEDLSKEMIKKAQLDEQIKYFASREEEFFRRAMSAVSRGMSAQNRKIYNLVGMLLFCECIIARK